MTATEKTPLTLTKSFRQVLTTLAAAKGPMTRSQIAAKVNLTDPLPPSNMRIAQESITYHSLEADGDIRVRTIETDMGEETCYEITAKGRRLLEKAGL